MERLMKELLKEGKQAKTLTNFVTFELIDTTRKNLLKTITYMLCVLFVLNFVSCTKSRSPGGKEDNPQASTERSAILSKRALSSASIAKRLRRIASSSSMTITVSKNASTGAFRAASFSRQAE